MEVGESARGRGEKGEGWGTARGRGWRRSEVGREGKIEGKVVNVPQGWVEVWLL